MKLSKWISKLSEKSMKKFMFIFGKLKLTSVATSKKKKTMFHRRQLLNNTGVHCTLCTEHSQNYTTERNLRWPMSDTWLRSPSSFREPLRGALPSPTVQLPFLCGAHIRRRPCGPMFPIVQIWPLIVVVPFKLHTTITIV